MSPKKVGTIVLGAALCLAALWLIVPVVYLFVSDSAHHPTPAILTSMVQQAALGIFLAVVGSWFVRNALRKAPEGDGQTQP